MSRSRLNPFWVLYLPLSILWAGLSFLRRRIYPQSRRYQSKDKVICIGNIHSGGSGKTPLVKELAQHFKNRHPVILSRGYRGRLSALGARIDCEALDGAALYGDEAWMLAHQVQAPVYVCKSRVKGMKRIESDFTHSLTLLDDGFQHFALKRNIDLVCVNTDKALEDSFCLPLGELREPLSALKAASAVVLVPGVNPEQAAKWQDFLKENFADIPFFQVSKVNDGLWSENTPLPLDQSENWAAFCAIAEPSRFQTDFSSLCPKGSFLRAFPDHHAYTPAQLSSLIEERKRVGATGFVTTDKDWYKVNDWLQLAGEKVVSLRIRYVLPDSFWHFLDESLARC